MPRVQLGSDATPSSAQWRAAQEHVLVRLMFTPGSSPLEPTHTFLSAYTAERLAPAVSHRVCLAAHELLSNATNYASLGSDVVLELAERGGHVCVRATNKAIPARLSMLRQQLDKIRQNAEETFNAELKRSMTGGVSRPMLGLARVAFEGGLELGMQVLGDAVTVLAFTR